MHARVRARGDRRFEASSPRLYFGSLRHPAVMRKGRAVEVAYVFNDEGEYEIHFKCPSCGEWIIVSNGQLEGELAIVCPECRWHGWADT